MREQQSNRHTEAKSAMLAESGSTRWRPDDDTSCPGLRRGRGRFSWRKVLLTIEGKEVKAGGKKANWSNILLCRSQFVNLAVHSSFEGQKRPQLQTSWEKERGFFAWSDIQIKAAQLSKIGLGSSASCFPQTQKCGEDEENAAAALTTPLVHRMGKAPQNCH